MTNPILLAAEVSDTGVPDVNRVNSFVPVVGTSDTTLPNVWERLTNSGTGIINILLWLAGLILVVSVITHAISYISSGGDTAKAGRARQGLINAAIGLIIVYLVFLITRVIVAFVR